MLRPSAETLKKDHALIKAAKVVLETLNQEKKINTIVHLLLGTEPKDRVIRSNTKELRAYLASANSEDLREFLYVELQQSVKKLSVHNLVHLTFAIGKVSPAEILLSGYLNASQVRDSTIYEQAIEGVATQQHWRALGEAWRVSGIDAISINFSLANASVELLKNIHLALKIAKPKMINLQQTKLSEVPVANWNDISDFIISHSHNMLVLNDNDFHHLHAEWESIGNNMVVAGTQSLHLENCNIGKMYSLALLSFKNGVAKVKKLEDLNLARNGVALVETELFLFSIRWKAFCEMLSGLKFKALDLSQNNLYLLPVSVNEDLLCWELLGESLAKAEVKKLKIGLNEFHIWSLQQIVAFGKMLEKSRVKELDISKEELAALSDENFSALIKGIKYAGITSLNLSQCNLSGISSTKLKVLIEEFKDYHFECLNLSKNDFLMAKATAEFSLLCEFLGNIKIKKLIMQSSHLNALSDLQLHALGQAFAKAEINSIDMSSCLYLSNVFKDELMRQAFVGMFQAAKIEHVNLSDNDLHSNFNEFSQILRDANILSASLGQNQFTDSEIKTLDQIIRQNNLKQCLAGDKGQLKEQMMFMMWSQPTPPMGEAIFGKKALLPKDLADGIDAYAYLADRKARF